MTVEPEKLTIKIDEHDNVTALLYFASGDDCAKVTVILGHGAGANQMSGFMRLIADGLAARGFDVLTFNFLYSERGRRVPDPKAKLESCYRAVIAAAQGQKKLKDNRLVIGGKSMGGRIASQVAATAASDTSEGDRAHDQSERDNDRNARPIAGLVFLGYPLHPPGKPDQLRAAHLQHIRAPMLFVQGSRDAFGTPEELRSIIKQFHVSAKLYIVEGGDHSFKVPKSSNLPQSQVYQAVMDEIARWLEWE